MTELKSRQDNSKEGKAFPINGVLRHEKIKCLLATEESFGFRCPSLCVVKHDS